MSDSFAPVSTITCDPLYDPAAPGATGALLRELGHAPNRTLGQNFLINRAALDRIITTAQLDEQSSVLEIGPGLGALTCRLTYRAARVVAIEKDPQFIDLLRRRLPQDRLTVIPADALKVSWDDLNLPAQNVQVVANLPYSISKPMLRRLMEEWRPHFSSLTVMVQREVADRLTAAPATNAYGPMAIMAALYTRTKRAFDVAPGSFLPPPNVTSSVVHCQILPVPTLHLKDEKWFWQVVRAAFAQRRKQLGNTLRAVSPRETVMGALEECNILPTRRGETLSLQEFALLAQTLKSVESATR